MVDWGVEKERFERLAYHRAPNAARRAFKRRHERKRDDAVAEMVAKVWATWRYNVEKGKDPVALLGANIYWAILFVRYDRKVAGRARSFDVYDFRAKMRRQELDGQGRPHPTEKGDRQNHWIDWSGVRIDDDPALWAEAGELLGCDSPEVSGSPMSRALRTCSWDAQRPDGPWLSDFTAVPASCRAHVL